MSVPGALRIAPKAVEGESPVCRCVNEGASRWHPGPTAPRNVGPSSEHRLAPITRRRARTGCPLVSIRRRAARPPGRRGFGPSDRGGAPPRL